MVILFYLRFPSYHTELQYLQRQLHFPLFYYIFASFICRSLSNTPETLQFQLFLYGNLSFLCFLYTCLPFTIKYSYLRRHQRFSLAVYSVCCFLCRFLLSIPKVLNFNLYRKSNFTNIYSSFIQDSSKFYIISCFPLQYMVLGNICQDRWFQLPVDGNASFPHVGLPFTSVFPYYSSSQYSLSFMYFHNSNFNSLYIVIQLWFPFPRPRFF